MPAADPTPTPRDMLDALGLVLCHHEDGCPWAQDADNGAIRISDRWGPDFVPEGVFRTGSRGPGGTYATFEDAVAAYYRDAGPIREGGAPIGVLGPPRRDLAPDPAAEERAAIVMLREWAAQADRDADKASTPEEWHGLCGERRAYTHAADAIERGEHKRGDR